MKTTKIAAVLAFAFAFAVSLSASAAPRSAKAPAAKSAPSIVVMEAVWTAGGPEYRAAVNQLADAYAYRMDAKCRAPATFSIMSAIQTYRVYTPASAESERNKLIRAQIATLACIGAVGEKRAAKLL